MFATLASTARFVPEHQVTNDALRARFGAEVIDKLEGATSIRTRFYAPEAWAASDVALPAAKQALARAGIGPKDVDLLIVGTDTPDYMTPSTAVVLQHKLGAVNAGVFDVGCACASMPTALAVAAGMMATQPWIRHALVTGVYVMHKLAAPDDHNLFFYGDGSSAIVLRAGDSPGFISSALIADGSYAQRWGIYAGGSAEPATVEAVKAGRTNVRLIDAYPASVNEEGWKLLVRQLAERGGFRIADIGLAIFTQVRARTIDKVMAALELPAERTHKVMEKWGYTGSACVGLALDDALEQKKAKAGDLLVLVGSGVGYHQAAVAFRL